MPVTLLKKGKTRFLPEKSVDTKVTSCIGSNGRGPRRREGLTRDHGKPLARRALEESGQDGEEKKKKKKKKFFFFFLGG